MLTKMIKCYNISFVLQCACIAVFFYFVHKAALAMDKSGMGDLSKFTRWNDYAAIAFWWLIGIWAVTMIISLSKKQNNNKRALWALILPIIIFVAGYIIALAM